MDHQSSLGAYGINTPGEPTATLRPDPSSFSLPGTADQYCKHTLDRDLLPDIEGFDWEVAPEQEGPAEILDLWRLNPKSFWDTDIDHERIPGNSGIFIDGARDYLKKYTLTEIEIPRYYSRFEEEFEHQYRWSADGKCWLSPQFLRRCVRLSNGSGRIDAEATTAFLCSPGTIIVTGPRGAFRCELPDAAHTVSHDGSIPKPPTEEVKHTIDGLDVPEEHPRLRTGFERWTALVNEYDPSEAYTEFNVGHEIRLASGAVTTLNANHLRLLEDCNNDIDAVRGTHKFIHEGDSYRVSVGPEDLPGAIGVEATVEPDTDQDHYKTQDPVTGIIAGYRLRWTEQDHIAPTSSGTRWIHCDVETALVCEPPAPAVQVARLPIASLDPTESG
ncbi:hypothetical protein [Halorientalis regularis]|uniref:hypothetical protein n=1 Tax=Halorientalis regularis TaxID=660518 RepID=UPI0011145BEE|nr:hypothetical protein [Halorientalis regularis]